MRKLKTILPWLLVLAAVAVSVLLLVRTYVAQKDAGLPQSLAAETGAAVAEGASGAASGVGDFFTWLFHWRTLAKENRDLSLEVARLRAENDRLTAEAAEYDALMQAKGFASTLGQPTLDARVVAADLGSWFNEFTVNRGTDDGVAVDQVVVCKDGLVGRVLSAEPTSSVIITLVDPRSAIAVTTQRSGDEGILQGCTETGAEEPLCTLKYLPFNADLVPGDTVLTSDLGGVFPRGLTVGTVTEASGASSASSYAIVSPAVDFAHLDYVLILTGGSK